MGPRPDCDNEFNPLRKNRLSLLFFVVVISSA